MANPRTLDTLHAMQARADRIRDMIRQRATTEANASGLGLGCQLHNAMISYREGKPRRGVDYRKVRRALWLLERQNRPAALVFDWYNQHAREILANIRPGSLR